MTLLQTKIGMPLDEFMEAVEAQPFELIKGKRIRKLPDVFGHSEILRDLFVILDKFALSSAHSEVFHKTTYIIADQSDANWVEGSRTPDLIIFTDNRIAKYETENPDCLDRPLALVPDLVVEVVSPSDKVSALDEKIDAYLSDSVRLIWVVDPQRRKSTVYAPDMEQPLHLNVNGVLDGGDVLPDFTLPLASIFNE